MKTALLFSIFLAFVFSENDCEMIYGSTFNTTLTRSSIANYCFTIVDSIFLSCMSDTSGGAISIHCTGSYGAIHECTFVYCQSKAQGGCVFFSGTNLEAFRCCCINCTSRYSSMFLKTEISNYGPQNTLCDMITILSSTSQFNAISSKNGNAAYTNINMTKSRASSQILAFELTELENVEVAYINLKDNKGDTKNNAIIYVLNELSENNHLIHHGNFIKNTCINGGFLFSFASEGTISDCIFIDNSRSILTAVRYYVTFVSCVFDGAESKTEFQTIKSCQFLTETSTWQFTMMDCNNKVNQLKFELGNQNKKVHIIQLKGVGYVAVVIGIICLLATIIFIIAKSKKGGDNEDVDKNENEDVLSATPLIKQ